MNMLSLFKQHKTTNNNNSDESCLIFSARAFLSDSKVPVKPGSHTCVPLALNVGAARFAFSLV